MDRISGSTCDFVINMHGLKSLHIQNVQHDRKKILKNIRITTELHQNDKIITAELRQNNHRLKPESQQNYIRIIAELHQK